MKNNLCKRIGLCLAVILLLPCLAGVIPASAAEGTRASYAYGLDDVNGKAISGSMIGVIRNMVLPLGGEINAKGWVATPEGISGYQYLWVPVGGADAAWQTVKEVSIFERGDLLPAGVPHQSGHSTAGFSLRIQPPEGTAAGYYDVYIRALDGMGVACDLVALLDLRYGEVDYDDRKSRLISFSRLMHEGEEATSGSPAITENALTIGDGDLIRLGYLNLSPFEIMRITYTVSPDGLAVGDSRRPILGLKSSGKHGYGTAGESYNLTHDLVYNALDPHTDEGVLEVDLTDCTYNGEVWLSGYLGGDVTVTEIELIYSGYVTNRMPATIRFSSDLIGGYFRGNNRTALTGVTDPVMGDVLRMEVTEATNDPYVHFDAGKLLEEHELVMDADDYKYMVILYRAEAHNARKNASFYLCAGSIYGATEDCVKGFEWKNDGKWHYMLLDLSETNNWTGLINGWRVDYLSGNSNPGDAVEFASVQFFCEEDAALEAASCDPMQNPAFHVGDTPVLKEMVENTVKENYVIDPEDTYVVTEPVDPPTAEPTDPPTDPIDPPTDGEVESHDGEEDTKPSGGQGCASYVSLWMIALLPVTAILVCKRRKRS